MDNSLIIHKEGNSIKVQLKHGGTPLDEIVFPLDIHFDTVLVTSIDKLFKKNRISRVSPLDIVLEGFEDQSSMSTLIAKAVVEALKIK